MATTLVILRLMRQVSGKAPEDVSFDFSKDIQGYAIGSCRIMYEGIQSEVTKKLLKNT